jgi:SAM-dependent methyltransferase
MKIHLKSDSSLRHNRKSRCLSSAADEAKCRVVGHGRRLECRPRTLDFYREHAREYCRFTANLSVGELYIPFLKEISKGSRILDAGCGSGRDTKAFSAKGFAVTAIDASPQIARMARDLTGQPCRVLSFQEMDFRNEFEGIWACASLVHVPRRDVSDVLRRLARALKPLGILYVSLKEGKGEIITPDGRLFCNYSLTEFAELLTADGLFKVAKVWKSKAVDSSGQDWLNFLARKTA